jgi:hypothetical protein
VLLAIAGQSCMPLFYITATNLADLVFSAISGIIVFLSKVINLRGIPIMREG